MNTRTTTVLLGAVLALVLRPTGLAAAPSEQVPTGPRAIAMGGAFSAVADDASALFWNPAGLSRIGNQEISGTYADLFGTGIEDNRMAFVLPLAPMHTIGLDWYHSGFSDSELDFGENRFSLSYGVAPLPRLALGATVKYLTRNTGLDGATVRDGNGLGADFGVLANAGRGLRLALVGQDVFDTELHYSDGGPTATAFPRNVRWAAAYSYRDYGTLALDVDDRVHVGAEVLPLDQVALRAGLQRDRRGNEEPTWSFGAGFKVGIFRLDYAYELHPVLDNTSHFGFSLAFHFNPSQIRIESVQSQDVYASLYKTYTDTPVGVARVRNLRDEPLTARLSIFVPGVMDSPTEREIVLRPKAAQDVPLTAVFSDDIMALSGDRPVQVEVTASYKSARVMRTDRAKGKAVIYEPGAINWGNGVAQAAAFVTQRDPVVDATAREAGRIAAGLDPDLFGNGNLAFAAAMFDALSTLGVAYVPDPNNPYDTISETEHAVDTVHYPRETLGKRTGDCDDTSVLMAALLGNVGVPTKFVDVPGHLMILVGTGVHERNRMGLAVENDLTVVEDGQVWIPVETTAIDKGFAEAWRMGAAAYRSWDARGQVQLVDVSASQARYEAATPPDAVEVRPLDEARLTAELTRDAAVVSSWRETYLAQHYGAVETAPAPTAGALAEVARAYYLAGRSAEAKEKLTLAVAADPGSARLHNNLAVVMMVSDEATPALGHLERALAIDASDPGIWLNVGLTQYMMGRAEEAAQALRKGVQLGGGYDGACDLLGLLPESGRVRGDARVLPAEELRELLRHAVESIPPDTVGVDSVGVPPERSKVPPGVTPSRLRVGAARAVDLAALKNHFYWKP